MKKPVPDVFIAGRNRMIRNHKYTCARRHFYGSSVLVVVDDLRIIQTGQHFIQIFFPAYGEKIVSVQPADDSVFTNFFFNQLIMVPQRRVGICSAQIAVDQGKMPHVVADDCQTVKQPGLIRITVMPLQATQVSIPGVIVKRQHLNHIFDPVAADESENRTHDQFHLASFVIGKRSDAGFHIRNNLAHRHNAGHNAKRSDRLSISSVVTAEPFPLALFFIFQAVV